MQNETLHQAIQDFPLAGLGGSYTFLDRLSRENDWSKNRGLRAIMEYRRFLYLAAVSRVPVTPPDAVDQVWHLHLLYTRSYWDTLCGTILRRPLHHGPTAGGKDEDEKFDDWYGSTRALYRAEFGEEPPADLWPARFVAEKRYRWIDLKRCWVIRKPVFGAVVPGLTPILLPGVNLAPVFLVWIFIALLLAWVLNRAWKREEGTSGSRDGGCGGFFGCGGDSGSGDCGSGGDCGGGDGGGGCGGGGCGGGGCGGGD